MARRRLAGRDGSQSVQDKRWEGGASVLRMGDEDGIGKGERGWIEAGLECSCSSSSVCSGQESGLGTLFPQSLPNYLLLE